MFMKVILCQNFVYDSKGTRWRCRRFLGALSRSLLDALRKNEDEYTVLRCPKCPKEYRYAKICYEKGKLTFRHCDPEEVPKIEQNWIEFENIEACEPVR